MNIEEYRNYCLQKQGISEEFPFKDNTLVYKVGGKIFTLTNILTFDRINVKCDPEKAIKLREKYPSIIPGWHMNKKHWNTIYLHEGLTNQQIYHWINHSYQMVLAGLPKKQQATVTASKE